MGKGLGIVEDRWCRSGLVLLILLIVFSPILAQPAVKIALVQDEAPDGEIEKQYLHNIKEEVNTLLEHSYDIFYLEVYPNDGEELTEFFNKVYDESDIIIAMGTVTSNYVFDLNNYPKPTIGTIVLDSKMQELTKRSDGTSGTQNFTYIESPFSLERDLRLLWQIYPFNHLLVVMDPGSAGNRDFLTEYIPGLIEEKISLSFSFYSDDIGTTLDQMREEKTAVYLLPYLGQDPHAIDNVLEVINEKKVPSAALFGEQYIMAGALVTHETGDNLLKLPRRIAIDVMKILEGQPVEDIPVEMETFSSNKIINMETARRIEIFPDFDVMAGAKLYRLENVQAEPLSFREVVADALQTNLDIRIKQADISIADTEIDIARSDLLPKVDVNSSILVNDEMTTLSRQGSFGRANWLAGGAVSQTVFAEPILANMAIKKILRESENAQLLQTQLDVIIDVATAYMNILFAKSNLNIQIQNVDRNKENYTISKAKDAIGYGNVSDVNRWEAELASANIELNNAYATLRQTRMRLNQLLNRPIDDPMDIKETTLDEAVLLFIDKRLQLVNDYGTLEKFANFLVDYAMNNLPELSLVDLGVRAEQRLQLSRERALYLPTIGLNGSANRVLKKINMPEGLPELDNATTWDLTIGVAYPIFQGNYRRKLIEQSKLSLLQYEDIRQNTANQLELLVRSNIETVGASYSKMELARTAAVASQKNYSIVQDAYSQGTVNITTLIDAQNNSLITELNSNNAVFSFILDYLNLERSFGSFGFLANDSERDDFYQMAQEYLNTK